MCTSKPKVEKVVTPAPAPAPVASAAEKQSAPETADLSNDNSLNRGRNKLRINMPSSQGSSGINIPQ